MDYTIENLEIIWDTFDFHTKKLGDLELRIVDAFDEVNVFLKNNLNPTQKQKLKARRSIDDCCEKSIASYIKQIHAIDDLINFYKHFEEESISIPAHREIKLSFLNELRSTTIDLMSVVSLYKDQITEILD